MENDKESSINTIHAMYIKYQEDPYMLSKINHYIQKQLPILLENTRNTRQQNILRIEELSLEQEQFIRTFLHRNHYYYIPSTEKFIFYDGHCYKEITEDYVLYTILNTISQERNPKLMSWKHKTKVTLLKRIKENKLTKTIPESETIQNVLNTFIGNLFDSKTETKYFLTILGDNILKKNTNHIHFLSTNICKSFIKEVNQTCVYYFGNQCTQTFKTKIHEKHYEYEMKDCRIMPVIHEFTLDRLETISILDVLCVACHYSIRYGNADNYLLRDIELEQKVMKLTKTSLENIVDVFIQEYIIELEDKKIQMTWQNMYYLWKMFLDTHHYPSSLYQSNIKTILTQEKCIKSYKIDGDFFVGMASSQWPNIQFFLRFWNETIVIDEFETDFEIEEINTLFHDWGESLKWKNGYLNETSILDAISYFFPETEIENQKYIHRIRSTLWDKSMDIQVALQELITSLKPKQERIQSPFILSIYDAYLFYCKFYSNPSKKTPVLVSKTYFEKYMMEQYNEYILENGVLSKEWIDEYV
jgi:hypothetical protein